MNLELIAKLDKKETGSRRYRNRVEFRAAWLAYSDAVVLCRYRNRVEFRVSFAFDR